MKEKKLPVHFFTTIPEEMVVRKFLLFYFDKTRRGGKKSRHIPLSSISSISGGKRKGQLA